MDEVNLESTVRSRDSLCTPFASLCLLASAPQPRKHQERGREDFEGLDPCQYITHEKNLIHTVGKVSLDVVATTDVGITRHISGASPGSLVRDEGNPLQRTSWALPDACKTDMQRNISSTSDGSERGNI